MIYYFANQIYQLSYAWSLYEEMGGTFLVRKNKTYIKFKHYLRGTDHSENATFMKTPKLQKVDLKSLSNLEGIILSQSNSRIHNDSKKSKSIFIGHGSGDKKYGGSQNTLLSYQYIFLSGPKHREKLTDVGVFLPENRLIPIGNLRFDDYINNKFDRNVLKQRMGISPNDFHKKTVLYAPTWRWGNGTLREYAKKFIKEITSEHNLIIRPHHFDAHLIPYYKLWASINGIKNVYFSNPNNLLTNDTMQDFLVSDILISDTSSILYEYLITSKPIIIANTDFSGLHNMPDNMNVMKITDFYDDSKNILDVINSNLTKVDNSKYTEMLNACFYFNDGKSVERAKSFITQLAGQKKQ